MIVGRHRQLSFPQKLLREKSRPSARRLL
jgi:hypothetical protein